MQKSDKSGFRNILKKEGRREDNLPLFFSRHDVDIVGPMMSHCDRDRYQRGRGGAKILTVFAALNTKNGDHF